MKRFVLGSLVLSMLVGAGTAHAQAGANTPQQQAYEQRRAELQKELEESQRRLLELRNERLTLTTRIESLIADLLQRRAQELLMSNEQTALQQLDAILTRSQDNLLAQRDRFTALGDVIRRRGGAVLVVLLRADSSAATQILGATTLTIDGEQVATRAYNVSLSNALAIGAVDPLYRSNVLPTAHTVNISVTVDGRPLTASAQVTATGAAVTYVQFAVRNGQVATTTWTSRGTTPF
jgi:TolA-binding protein